MIVRKAVKLIYVSPIPTSRSGIGRDVPAHVVLEWYDSMGRRCTRLLSLSREEVESISILPNEPIVK